MSTATAAALTAVTAVLGLISGVIGTVLGVMNFLRDRAKVDVHLQWDVEPFGNHGLDLTHTWGLITVTNVGRRSIHVSHLRLKLPKGYSATHRLLGDTIQGKTLTEASPALIFPGPQDGLDEFSRHWRDVVAEISDSTGRVWVSKRIAAKTRPTWAGG